MKNIFVVGLDPFNLRLLERISADEAYAFHAALTYAEVVRPPENTSIDLFKLLDLAEERLKAFPGDTDAIIGYWDFPSSVIVPILRGRHGQVGPPLEAVATCEHKFWCRSEQKRVIPEFVPRFCAVNPFAEDPLSQIDLAYPFWIKPVKAHSSYLGFKIQSASDFRACLPIIQSNIWRFGQPFDTFLSMIETPQYIEGIGGHWCIAEEIISAGRQCTLEGYATHGEMVIYGVVDSIRSGRHRSSFARYQYPSQLPWHVQNRMIETATRFMRHIGYDKGTFNIEFFWDPQTDKIWVLEVNTRLSKSHSPLFKMVDGEPHQKIDIEIALGQPPKFPHRTGRHRIAGKFMVRVFEDGTVRSAPSQADIKKLQQKLPDAMVRLMTHEGSRLAHMAFQDSYSFELAEVFLGANDQIELLEKYRIALEMLPFQIDPLKPEAT